MASNRKTRLVAILLSTLGALTVSSGLSAQTSLEDRVAALEKRLGELAAENQTLKEKIAAKPAAAPVTAGGKEDKLVLGGFFQIHAETGDAPDSRYAGINDRIVVRRARVNLRGNFGPAWSFKVESDFGANTLGSSTGYRAQITDAYVEWNAHPEAQVRLGQFKTPFGWEQLLPDTLNPFVERSLPSDRLTFGRQIGAGLFGVLADKRIDYTLAAFNGNGVNLSNNDNSAFMTAARVGAKAWTGKLGQHNASWSFAANALASRDTGTFNGRRRAVGFDTQFQTGPLVVRGEWLANRNTTAAGAATKSDGWSVATLYDLAPAWQLAARFETYDSNTALPGTETDTLVFGVNHRLAGNDIVLSVDYFAGNADLGGHDDRLSARVQVIF